MSTLNQCGAFGGTYKISPGQSVWFPHQLLKSLGAVPVAVYQQEMKDYPLELPTVTFDKTHVIKDRSGELQLPWPKTIDTVSAWKFDHIIAGHGPVQDGRARMSQFRNYI